ncbi:MAG TPA: substrate-binding domain-containing protein [Steroidobacteraceae bacterium]
MDLPKVAKTGLPTPFVPPRARRSRAPQGKLGLHLRYAFEPGEQCGAEVHNALFDLLAAVTQGGSIRHAAKLLNSSYRHVWDSLRKWEAILGEPLVIWSQGRKARPTEFAERLAWAERRARIRMQPHIEALRSDLERVLIDARDDRDQLLTLRASHDLALPVLQQHAARAVNLHLNIGFQGSVDALRALNDRQCHVAGFHVPALPGGAPIFANALKPWLKPKLHRLIACSRRTQGVMVRKEHAALIHEFPDLVRHRLRFVNRQPGSGTRMLVDHLFHEHAIAPGTVLGEVEHIENTHVSVALCVASGVVDAGVGIEAAALQFGLHFVPVVEENYFLACLAPNIDHPAVDRLRELLAGPRWRAILADLPGYRSPDAPGSVLMIEKVFPWWRHTTRG